jgi:hypothetical protein
MDFDGLYAMDPNSPMGDPPKNYLKLLSSGAIEAGSFEFDEGELKGTTGSFRVDVGGRLYSSNFNIERGSLSNVFINNNIRFGH